MNRLHKAIEVAVVCTALGMIVITPLLVTRAIAEPEHHEVIHQESPEQVVEKGGMAPPLRSKAWEGREPVKPKPFILDETTCPGDGCFCISSYDDKGNLTEVRCSGVRREEEVQ